jgi:ADP-L-glycero-D-manno-heptose 6-epimerase
MIVVTGASGFIGSTMVSCLNSFGTKNIAVIDEFEVDHRLGYASNANYTNLQSCEFSTVHPIITNKDSILPVGDIQAVFHFGAISNTLEKDTSRLYNYNTHYTYILGQVCRQRGIPLLFSSTAAVYGNGHGPLNLYAKSKRISENDISDHAICFRLFNVYGPNESHKGRMASVIHHWYNQLANTGTLEMFEGSHEYKRDFVWVKDVCRVFHDAYLNYKPGIYDLGSGRSESLDVVAKTVIAAHGGGEIREIPMPSDLTRQYQTNTQSNIAPIKNNGWCKNMIGIDKGIPLYIEKLRKTRCQAAS